MVGVPSLSEFLDIAALLNPVGHQMTSQNERSREIVVLEGA
jgi:hypothetical protein